MSTTTRAAQLLLQTVLTIGSASGIMYTAYAPINTPASAPTPIVQVQPEAHTPAFEQAFFQAAKVYGKAGCGDQQLAEMTARHALATSLPPAIVAATIAAESACNSMAVSNRGALGLMQVTPRTWSKKYDFSHVNLLNPEENVTVGTDILSALVKEHGIRNGLLRYYGTGSDGIGLGGAGYAERVLALAGKV